MIISPLLLSSEKWRRVFYGGSGRQAARGRLGAAPDQLGTIGRDEVVEQNQLDFFFGRKPIIGFGVLP